MPRIKVKYYICDHAGVAPKCSNCTCSKPHSKLEVAEDWTDEFDNAIESGTCATNRIQCFNAGEASHLVQCRLLTQKEYQDYAKNKEK